MHTQVFSKVLTDIYAPELTREQWPIMLTISITNKCNIRCWMCKTHFNDTPESVAKYQDMPEELFLKIEPLISKVYYIILSGGGEPTIAHRFLQRVRRIRQLNPNVYLQIFTNGVLLSSLEFAEEMIPLFDYIHLSLNGIKSYKEISGGHSFENIKRSMENIKLVRKQLEKPCQLAIGFILMRKNLKDIVEAAILAKEMGADEILYEDLWVRNHAMRSESARHHAELASLMLEEIQKATQVGITVRCGLWPRSSKRDTDPTTLKIAQGLWGLEQILPRYQRDFQVGFKDFSLSCYNPWGSVNVFQSGVVYLCCNGATHIGNLKEKSFEEIWFGDEARHYREGMIAGHYYKECARCKCTFKDDPKSYERDREFPRRNLIKKRFFANFLRNILSISELKRVISQLFRKR